MARGLIFILFPIIILFSSRSYAAYICLCCVLKWRKYCEITWNFHSIYLSCTLWDVFYWYQRCSAFFLFILSSLKWSLPMYRDIKIHKWLYACIEEEYWGGTEEHSRTKKPILCSSVDHFIIGYLSNFQVIK